MDGISGGGVPSALIVGVTFDGFDGISPLDKDEDVADSAKILIKQSAHISGLWELRLALSTAIEYPSLRKPGRAPGIGAGSLDLVLRKYPLDKAGAPGNPCTLTDRCAVFGHSRAAIVATDLSLSDFGERGSDDLGS